MSHEILVGAFIAIFLLEFAAFGMQRATLLISREADVSPMIAKLLLPAWFPAVWLLCIAKWGTVLLIGFSWSWVMAGVLIVADAILAAILPIPYSVYVPSFRKRIAQIKDADARTGAVLEAILNASKIHGFRSDVGSGMSIDLLKSRRTSQAWEINGDILLFRVEQSHLVH